MQQAVGEVAPELKALARVKRPAKQRYYRAKADQVQQYKQRDADKDDAKGQRPGALFDSGKKRIAFIAEANAAVAGTPAGSLITRVAGVGLKTFQLGTNQLSLAFICQPDVALSMLLNGKNNALGRHIVDKSLRHARVGERGDHYHESLTKFVFKAVQRQAVYPE
ncbi:hypothetical protein HMPREF0201_04376 [Cedecea davisae DSM 4568]|uniref:Uncharacterized protein n=1 Tax=Cedecea davisae DSM 4568 TaxID=566551 RepID=S3JIQ2_9ENTR|nr:hypothetical protein HMPREF0201_04376 [Cedecea davisae DSM 4568]